MAFYPYLTFYLAQCSGLARPRALASSPFGLGPASLWETLARTTGDDLLARKRNEEQSDEAEEEGRCRMYNIKYIYYMNLYDT